MLVPNLFMMLMHETLFDIRINVIQLIESVKAYMPLYSTMKF